MTFQESDLVQLKKALLSGTQSISMGGRTVTFQSLEEIKKTIKEIEAKIAADAEEAIVPNKVVATFQK